MGQFSSEAHWIRLAGSESGINDHIDFRKNFFVEKTPHVSSLLIAADSDFVVKLDEKEVGRGQYSDYPDAPTWSEFPLPELQKGEHLLTVLFFYRGKSFSTYRVGPAGLIAEIPGITASDATWRCRRDPAFRSGPIEDTTFQLGFAAEYDARNEDDWQSSSFDDSSWGFAEEFDRPGELSLRPVPPCAIKPPQLPVEIVSTGFLCRQEKEYATFADAVAGDFLAFVPPGRFFKKESEFGNAHFILDGLKEYSIPVPAAPANGAWLIVDLGSEQTGLLSFELDAQPGVVLDISHGEHLADGRVRNKIGSRCFTDRYITKAGCNRFTLPFRRLGCRYLQVNITNFTQEITLRLLTLKPAEFPLPEAVPFDCGDDLANHLRSVAVNTLRLCMHEHYEDCPWREQALYSYDSRNQALYGYYVWGNREFAKACFTLLGKGLRKDGWLELCAPAEVYVTIPVFTLVWIMELAEYELFSGDDALYRRFSGQIDRMLRNILDSRDPQSGLIRLAPGKEIWNFYEWVPGLESMGAFDPEEFSALFNLYLVLALRSMAQMCRCAGADASEWEHEADLLAVAVDQMFWNPAEKCYATTRNGDCLTGLHEHTQALALLCNCGDAGRRQMTIDRILTGNGLTLCSFSALPFVAQALMPTTPQAREFVCNRIRKEFHPMLRSENGTLWETASGECDFDGAGSLCHAWSSLPVYIQSAWQLGVQPLEPGFKRFRVAPVPCGIHKMQGEVPTPHGNIKVCWLMTRDGLEIDVTAPEKCGAVFHAWPEAPIHSIRLNGKNIN